MKSFSSTKIDLQNGSARVSEEEFKVSSALLTAALKDELKYGGLEEVAVADSALAIEEGAEVVERKYQPSPTFADKMLKADELLQDRYDELKNYALRYRKVKSRISKKFDSINQGRLQLFKLSIAGKTLKLYLNMPFKSCDPKYHCKNVKDKKTYVDVPVLLRVKSGRAVRYAKLLIDQCAQLHGLKENPKFVPVDAIKLVEEAK